MRLCALYCVATQMRRMPEFSAFDSAKSMIRDLPPKNTAGFARRSVSSISRLPRPPAIEDRIGRAVAFEHLVRQEPLERRAGDALRGQLGARLVRGLAERQRLGLRQIVGEQLLVVVAERRLALRGGEEVGRDELG